jgi:uncharacterized protein (DUF302 family)
MQTERKEYVISVETDLSFDEAVNRTRDLLKEAGYGVLCEIDVKAKLEEKLGVEREPYMILGACDPPLASEGLNAEPDLGALLPCNVVIYEREGRTRVAAVEPERMLSKVGNEELESIATRVREDLARVVEEIAKC